MMLTDRLVACVPAPSLCIASWVSVASDTCVLTTVYRGIKETYIHQNAQYDILRTV